VIHCVIYGLLMGSRVNNAIKSDHLVTLLPISRQTWWIRCSRGSRI